MPKLKFYDMKKKQAFFSDKFDLEEVETSRGVKFFATTMSPSGTKAYRIISKAMFNELSLE